MTFQNLKDELGRLTRYAEHVVSPEELRERLAESRPLRVKLGLDPTAADVTLGWAVPLRKLRAFQEAGHTAVLIVGDFTARVGDPSGRSATRPRLGPEDIEAHLSTYRQQAGLILREDRLEVRRNS
ncbi:MAG: tyrosine--tRNA ligase, partial [Chloroflexota bacterium]|nr:tyrosine--tRNA ligase [Chloroflexota bacterium]